MTFDSTADTLLHKKRVLELMINAIESLLDRAVRHDDSKLCSPEKEGFDEFTPRLREAEYGSDEYFSMLREMEPFLSHHYATNAHHPQFHEAGIHGMSLLDLLEMVCDWKAATERVPGGDIEASIEKNRERFGFGDEIAGLLRQTAKELFWID